MGVVFAGKLVCSVNVLYMAKLGSLDWSTRALEHVIVQISFACNTTDGFINCFHLIWMFFKLI